MSLHDAAQHLAAQGRGPDDRLIHMSSKEIAGLQALAKSAGGSLTINPETGLAEAGFLDNLLPTLIGAGLAYATGGTSLALTPGMIGLGVGGLEAARTGDLGKGLKAGLGAYGGAGMFGAADTAGMFNGAEAATAPAAPSAGGLAGPSQVMPGVENARDELLLRNTGYDNARDQLLSRAVAPEQAASQLANTTSSMASPSVGDLVMQNKGYAASAAAPAVMGTMEPKGAAPAGRDQMIRPYTFAANAQTPQNMIGTTYQPGQDTSERMWFQPSYSALTPYKAAQGGLTDLARIATGENVMPMEQEEKMATGGGISTLGGYAAGGSPRLLKGPGDGMSDNIPAMIGTKQPARLADGEFVVPADVVSHLGNGSTDAGAKQLYKMMDRIRSQRTGKKKQAPQVNPAKAMPA